MINLIPPSAKKIVVKEYWLRVATIWLFAASFSLALVLALQIPVYVLVTDLESSIASQFNSVREQKNNFDESEKLIKDANNLITHLSENSDSYQLFSSLVYELDGLAGSDVTLTKFSMTRSEDEIDAINLIGNATDRISLSKFRDDLKKHELIGEVELPISNLVKDKDIVFSMKVTLN